MYATVCADMDLRAFLCKGENKLDSVLFSLLMGALIIPLAHKQHGRHHVIQCLSVCFVMEKTLQRQ